MIFVREYESYTDTGMPLFLALGNFDGLHLGHMSLLNDLIYKAKQAKGISAAFIFEPHPNKILFPQQAPKMLLSSNRKAEMLENMGLGLLIYNTFNTGIAEWSPEDFVKMVIVEKLKAHEVFIGFNYSFGHKGMGTPKTMEQLGLKYGFGVNVFPSVNIDNRVVSSTLIRETLESGDVETCKNLLNYYPFCSGIVARGEGRGRSLGFPTANLLLDPEAIVPGAGVYAANAIVNGAKLAAVVNIGNKPTFHNQFPLSIEAHIIDFAQNLYDQSMELHFIKKLRCEKKFTSISELVAQIERDKCNAIEQLRIFDK